MSRYIFPDELLMWKRISVLGVLVGVVISLFVIVKSGILNDPSTGRPEDQTIQEINERIGIIQDQLSSLNSNSAFRVTVTSYNSRVGQTDSTPRITAVMTPCRPGMVAVSRDLLENGWTFGRKVWIEGHGVFVIGDIMAKRKARHIDIWQPAKARQFRQDNVLAVVIK